MDSQQEKIPHRGDHSTSGSLRIRAPTVVFVLDVFAVVNFVVVFCVEVVFVVVIFAVESLPL